MTFAGGVGIARAVRRAVAVMAAVACAVTVLPGGSVRAVLPSVPAEYVLQQPSPFPSDEFGVSLSATDDGFAVGGAGAAWVVTAAQGGESLQELVPSGSPTYWFGRTVGSDGSTIAVLDRAADSFRGQVHVFERVLGQWSETAVLAPPQSLGPNEFQTSVALSDGLVAAATRRGTSIWQRDFVGTWSLRSFIPSTAVLEVALSDDSAFLVVTEYQAGEITKVFDIRTTTPVLLRTLPVRGDIDVDGQTLVVGLPYATPAAQVHLYDLTASATEPTEVIPADPDATFRFGEFVSISDGLVFTTMYVGGDSVVNVYGVDAASAGPVSSFRHHRGLGWGTTGIASVASYVAVGEYGNAIGVAGSLYVYKTPITVDVTPPVIVCRSAPSVLPGRPVEVSADVSDESASQTSVVRQRATAPNDQGLYHIDVTASDAAGNSLTVSCPFQVADAVRVDVAPDGSTSNNSAVRPLWASADGEQALFTAAFVNIGQPGLPSDIGGLYLKDLVSGEIELASVDSIGNPAPLVVSAAVDGQGRHALFATANSRGILELRGPSPTPCEFRSCAYIRDLHTGQTSLAAWSSSNMNTVGVSSDGNRIVYRAGAELFWKDLTSGTTRWLDQLPDGRNVRDTLFLAPGFGAGNGLSASRPLSPDGRFVLVQTLSSLVASDTDSQVDAYAIDATTGVPTLLSSLPDASISGREMSTVGNSALIQVDYLAGGSDLLLVDVVTAVTTKIDLTPSGLDVVQPVGSALSADGRFASFVDAVTARMFAYEIATGLTSVVVGPSASFVPEHVASSGLAFFGRSTSAGGFWVMTVEQVDVTPPVVSGEVSPAANEAGWHDGPVLVTWSVDDVSATVPPPMLVPTEGAGQVVTSGPACDSAGNCGTGSLVVNVDFSAPSADVLTSLDGNGAGWNNAAVTASVECLDSLSGVAACPDPVILSGEGAGQVASFTVVDVAGNVTSVASRPISIDVTAPTVTLFAPANGSSVLESVYAVPTCEAQDALSGLNGVCVVMMSDPVVSPGRFLLTATAIASDLAGNTASASSTYTVLTDVDGPTISSSASPEANQAGWWNTAVTFSFACADPAGVAGCPSPVTRSVEGAGQSFDVSAADLADNVSVLTVSGVNIDLTAPVVSVSAPSSAGPLDMVTITCAAADSLSGIDTADCADMTFPATVLVEGANVFSFTATDRAGNARTATRTVTLVLTSSNIGALITSYAGNQPGAGGLVNSLVTKLDEGDLTAFINEVNARCCLPSNGKRFTRAQADTLILLATQFLT